MTGNLTRTNLQVLARRGYEPTKLLASGAFGQVFQGRSTEDGRVVAIKVVELSALRPKERALVMEEIGILSSVQHKNILEFHEAFTDSAVLGGYGEQDTVYIVTECLTGGDLFDRITKKLLTEEQALDIARQILSALLFLKERDLCHRDIKLENVCVASELDGRIHVKLIDFGYATHLHGATLLSGAKKVGTLNYFPPQIVQREMYNPHKMDIWSLGVVLYSGVCGRFPFYGPTESATEKMIAFGDPSFQETQWSHTTKGFRILVSKMLRREESLRLDLSEALGEVLSLERSLGMSKVYFKNIPISQTHKMRSRPIVKTSRWLRKGSRTSLEVLATS